MPPMPSGDPFSITDALLQAEGQIRAEKKIRASDFAREPYWADIIRLLQVFWATKRRGAPGFDGLDELKGEFHCEVYRSYLERRLKTRVLRNTKANGSS